MSDPEATLPPRKPNTPRNLIAKAVAWGKLHPDWLLAFFLGFVAGAVLL